MRPFLDNVQLELSQPPDGVTLKETAFTRGAATFVLAVDAQKVKSGVKGNLVVEGFTQRTFGQNEDGSGGGRRRVSIGFLPAIPFEIVGGNGS
jgi:hypothetical protein